LLQYFNLLIFINRIEMECRILSDKNNFAYETLFFVNDFVEIFSYWQTDLYRKY